MKLEVVFKNGRKETFSNVESFKVREERVFNEEYDVAQIPKEERLFEVNPLEINQTFFEKSRSDQKQEKTRQLILEAFAEVGKHPEKYASKFYTFIPEKKWNGAKTVTDLKEYANGLMADWVEQALEWAQRISNGERWERLCNQTDTANWYRMVVWKNGYCRLIGGTRAIEYDEPATYVEPIDFYSYTESLFTVPLIVIRKP